MEARRTIKKRVLFISLICGVAAAIIGAFVAYRIYEWSRPFAPLSEVRTLAGASNQIFGDPFGVAVSRETDVYVSDGVRGCVWRIASDGSAPVAVIANLNTPSGIAFAPDDTLIIAEAGAHTIKRFNARTNQLTIVAGVEGRAGFADGRASEALFDAPIGLTVGADGIIYVADTYNDSIRVIDVARNEVRTLAGVSGEPGYADAGQGRDARFDTPCGIAVGRDGALVVADTGNNRLRRVELSGATTTLTGTGEAATRDGSLFDAAFDEPVGITVGGEGSIYVTDAGGAAVREVRLGENASVRTLAGGATSLSRLRRGFADGALDATQFDYVTGIVAFSDGALVVADAGNNLVRAIVGERRMRGEVVAREAISARRMSIAEFRANGAARWPFNPPERVREIAATFGEIRGELKQDEISEAWFHNGLDIAGAFGETVRAVRDERVLRPLIVASVGTARERIRLPSIGYVHLRVGRDRENRALDDGRFIISRDAQGSVTRVRVRRGTRFAAGDALGTLNEQYHVHLIAGRIGEEWNALAALALPGVRDAIAPTIEEVMLASARGEIFYSSRARGRNGTTSRASNSRENQSNARASNQTATVRGEVRIVVRAHDRMDGNPARRRLGLYRLGYQIFDADGNSIEGFAEPSMTISFETLPDDAASVPFIYAPLSRSGYTPDTVFDYIVTNRVRERRAAEDYWNTSALAPGDYVVRVVAEDFFGNRTTRDVPVRVTGSAGIPARRVPLGANGARASLPAAPQGANELMSESYYIKRAHWRETVFALSRSLRAGMPALQIRGFPL